MWTVCCLWGGAGWMIWTAVVGDGIVRVSVNSMGVFAQIPDL